jgi:hypothetical protein
MGDAEAQRDRKEAGWKITEDESILIPIQLILLIPSKTLSSLRLRGSHTDKLA